MSTSDKLTYLSGTKDKLKTTINYTGANITNDTFRSYPEKLYNKYIDIINNGTGTLYSNMPKVNGQGSSLTLNNTESAPMLLSLYGETQQDSTTGKNLLPTNSFTLIKGSTRTLNIDFSSPIPAGTYTLSCKITNKSGLTTSLGLSFQLYDSEGSLVGFNTITSDTTSPYSSTKTITSQATKLYCYLSNSLDDSATITIDEFMLESGSTATSFEPYTGGSPAPSPDYPQPIHNVSGDNTIEICGKNLFSSELEQGAYSTGDGKSLITSEKYVRTKNKIIVQPNTTYTLSLVASSFTGTFLYYKKDGTYIGASSNFNANKTFTTDNETYYINIDFYRNAGIVPSDITNTMLNEGNQASTYEPYTGNSQLISLGVKNLLTLTDGTFTDDNNLTVTIANGKVTLNGSTNANYLWLNLTNKDYRYGTPNASNKPLWFSSTLIEKGQYSISSSNSNITSLIRVMFTDASAVSSTNLPNTTTKDIANVCIYIASSGTTFDNETFDLQITKGSTPQYVSASPIELNKISTYQDYIYKDNDRWFLHKEIGKVVLDGSEEWTGQWASDGRYGYRTSISDIYIAPNSNTKGYLKSNYFIDYTQNELFALTTGNGTGISLRQSQSNVIIRNDSTTSTTNFKNWLSTHNTEIYYVLATSTDTEITDTTLLEQLNNLEQIKSKKNQTNINQENNDLPFIITASALKEYE